MKKIFFKLFNSTSLNLLIRFSLTTALASCARPNYQDALAVAPSVGQQEFFAQYLAQMTWVDAPAQGKLDIPATMNLQFSKKENPTVFVDPPGQIKVLLWMPSMGHGSAPVLVEKKGPGQYLISKMYFVMKGDWEVRVQIGQPDQQIEEIKYALFIY